MNKNQYLKSLKVLLTIGVLLGLAGSSTALAQIPIGYTSSPILENEKPVAQADEYTVDADTTLSVPAPGVLANDTDADGDPLSALAVGIPAFGTLTLRLNGSFDYVPDAGYVGDDHFTYKATDGALNSNPVMVTVHVVGGGGNTAPVAAADSYTAEMDTLLEVDAASGVLANDLDADGDPLTAVQFGVPAHGILTFYDTGAFRYQPDAGYTGMDTFAYRAYDGIDYSITAVVTIDVTGGDNIAPVANADNYAADVDTILVVDALSGLLANDYDANGDPMTAQLVISPVNGILNLQPDGSFTYTPDLGYTGDDHFTYRAFDGLVTSAPAMVTISVSGTSSFPVAVTDAYTTTLNTTLIVPAPGVLCNDTDPNLDPLSAELTGAPIQFGDLTFSSDGSFIYVPATNNYGSVYFTYRAFDGTYYSNPVQVTIDVESTNTPPVAVADSYLMLAGTTLTVDAAHGVLVNDTDADSDPLTATLLGIPVVNGVLNFNSDGSFTYTPNAGFSGNINFTYQAEDWLDNSNPVIVTITVKATNTAPVATADMYLTAPDTPLTVAAASGVLLNDSDAEADLLEAQLVDNVDHGTLALNDDGSFLYTPNAGYEGQDSFTYRAFDGLATSAAVGVTIYVTDDNIAPFARADAYLIAYGDTLWVQAPGVLVNDYDLNGTSLIAQLQHGTDHGTLWLNIDGSFEYVPDPGFLGVDSFTYRAYDGDLLSSAVTVTIYVYMFTYLPMMRK